MNKGLRLLSPNKLPLRLLSRIYCISIPHPSISVGACSSCGRNRDGYNEDRYSFEKFAPNIQYFGIFDGHNGNFVSQFLNKNLPIIMKKKILAKNFYLYDPVFDILEEILVDSFVHCQKILEETIGMMKHLRRKDMVGSTAVVALLIDNKYLTVANVGDSKAILCRNGNPLELSVEHVPTNMEEVNRVELNGGWIDWDTRLKPLVNGRLSMTRSFGNLLLKPNIVTCHPTIRSETIDYLKDSFFVLCSDGITHAITDEELTSIVNHHENPIDAAQDLISTAHQYGSLDDATAIVVPLSVWGCGNVSNKHSNYSIFRTMVGGRSDG